MAAPTEPTGNAARAATPGRLAALTGRLPEAVGWGGTAVTSAVTSGVGLPRALWVKTTDPGLPVADLAAARATCSTDWAQRPRWSGTG